MSFMKNPELRCYLRWMVVCLLVLLGLGFLITGLLQAQYQDQILQHDAALLGTLLQLYPEQETALVSQLTKSADASSLQAGLSALNLYNYTPAEAVHAAPLFGLFTVLCFLLSALVSCVCLYKIYQKIHRITQYLHQAAKGETPSPLLEAEEGSFGYLANESTKVVHSLYRKASQSDEDKAALSRAISDISHQIKTPITSMTMLTDILLEQPVPEAQRVLFLQRIQAQLGRIKWLVDALLKLSKLDSGSVVMEKKTISCETLLEQCMLPLYPILQQRQITYLPSGQLNTCFVGDLSWMTEAVGNVIKNCIEHTPPHGKLYIQASGNPLYTELQIRDTGEGIDPEDIPHLFERFYRGKNASPDSVGIGLALSRSIIEQQNGVIDVSSTLKKGSCFSIRMYHGVV